MQQNPDMAQLLQMAQSPAGQKLIALLQQSGGNQLESALQKASQGDYTDAKSTIQSLLGNAEAQALLRQLGGSK